jgi:hypothetical protein
MPTIKLPVSLFTTFQTACKIEAKRICKQAAKLLQRPEKEVLDKVFASQLVVQIIDDDDRPLTCPILLRHATLVERCRRPCILGTGKCINHQTTSSNDSYPSDVLQVTRIDYKEDLLWCDESTGNVYNSSGSIVGFYKDECLELISFDTSNETNEQA